MARSIRHARRRTLLVTAAVATVIAVAVVPAWASFPDQGSRVLFARAKAPATKAPTPARGVGVLDLFTMKPNGDDQVRVVKTDTILEYGGHWSPNGARITFAGSKGKGNLDVYTAMADGSKRKQLTTTASNYSPNWSKNGQQIVWTRLGGTFAARGLAGVTQRGIDANLMVMNADGTDKHSIFTGLAMAPAWSPSAGRIAFSTYDGDSVDIAWIKPNGLGLQQLTNFGSNTYSFFGDWAPDGNSFAMLFNSGAAIHARRGGIGGYDLFRGTPEGTKPIFLAADADLQFSPVFTADGSRVIFVRQDGNDYELYSVKADGSGGEKQLTTNAGDDFLSVVPLI
jgi:Tol biopolymer transport system component